MSRVSSLQTSTWSSINDRSGPVSSSSSAQKRRDSAWAVCDPGLGKLHIGIQCPLLLQPLLVAAQCRIDVETAGANLRLALAFLGGSNGRGPGVNLVDQRREVLDRNVVGQPLLREFDALRQQAGVDLRLARIFRQEFETPSRDGQRGTRTHKTKRRQPAFVTIGRISIVLEHCVSATARTIKDPLLAFDLGPVGIRRSTRIPGSCRDNEHFVDGVHGGKRGRRPHLYREVIQQRSIQFEVVAHGLHDNQGGLLVLRFEIRNLPADLREKRLNLRTDFLRCSLEGIPPVLLQRWKFDRRSGRGFPGLLCRTGRGHKEAHHQGQKQKRSQEIHGLQGYRVGLICARVEIGNKSIAVTRPKYSPAVM